MAQDLELMRTADNRRTFELSGHGTLRLEGWRRDRAQLVVSQGAFLAKRRGFRRNRVELLDAGGSIVGGFVPGGAFRRGGEVQLQGRRLSWEPSSRWRSRFVLRDGARELARFEARGRGKRPVNVRLQDAQSSDDLAVLFGCWLAKVAADDAMSAAAASSAVAS